QELGKAVACDHPPSLARRSWLPPDSADDAPRYSALHDPKRLLGWCKMSRHAITQIQSLGQHKTRLGANRMRLLPPRDAAPGRISKQTRVGRRISSSLELSGRCRVWRPSMMALHSRLTKTIFVVACALCGAGPIRARAQDVTPASENGGKCPTAGA